MRRQINPPRFLTSLYYFPNRPSLVSPDPDNPIHPKPDYINSLEKEGRYIAEKKWNGENCLLYIKGGRKYEFWNRYKSQLRYQPSSDVLNELEQLPEYSIINVELLHTKIKNLRHTLIVHCIMAWEGQLLSGKTWDYSRQILQSIKSGHHLKVSEVYRTGFWDLYKQADGSIIEGIILKDPTGKLVFSTMPISNVNWMIKIRVPSVRPDGTMKKYAF